MVVATLVVVTLVVATLVVATLVVATLVVANLEVATLEAATARLPFTENVAVAAVANPLAVAETRWTPALVPSVARVAAVPSVPVVLRVDDSSATSDYRPIDRDACGSVAIAIGDCDDVVSGERPVGLAIG